MVGNGCSLTAFYLKHDKSFGPERPKILFNIIGGLEQGTLNSRFEA